MNKSYIICQRKGIDHLSSDYSDSQLNAVKCLAVKLYSQSKITTRSESRENHLNSKWASHEHFGDFCQPKLKFSMPMPTTLSIRLP